MNVDPVDPVDLGALALDCAKAPTRWGLGGAGPGQNRGGAGAGAGVTMDPAGC